MMKVSVAALCVLAFLFKADGSMLRGRGEGRALQAPYYSTQDLGAIDLDVSLGNPYKGLLTNPNWSGANYEDGNELLASMEFVYIRVNDVVIGDPATGDAAYDWTAFEAQLSGSASRNKHAIPRFFLHYPNQVTGVPAYLLSQITLHDDPASGDSETSKTPDFNDPILLTAIDQFIQKFGQNYDGDPRISFLQMGLIGYWGEWHTYPNNAWLNDTTKDTVGAWFLTAFPQTMMQTRNPRASLLNTGVGLHDDSFTYSTLDGAANGGVTYGWFFWPTVISSEWTDSWKAAVMGGETRPENQGEVFESTYPAGTEFNQDFDLCVDTTHATYMLHANAFSGSGLSGQELVNAKSSSARMGYNFHVSEVTAAESSQVGEVDIGVTIHQVGVAPFYFPLSLGLSCADLTSGIMTVSGINSLIEYDESAMYQFIGVPATSACLGAVTLSLESPNLYPGNPIKFAQGDGTLVLNVPLPPNENQPTSTPTMSSQPSSPPTDSPTTAPVTTDAPTDAPQFLPTTSPSDVPTLVPTTCNLTASGETCKKNRDCCSNICSGRGNNKECA